MRRATRPGAALLAGLVFALVAARAGALDVRVASNHRLGDDRRAARGLEIPGLAVDPTNPAHVVEVNEDFRSGNCEFHVTFDTGATWQGGVLKAPAGYPDAPCIQFDRGGYSHSNGAVTFGRGQNVFSAFTAAKPGAGDGILVAKSTDGGRTFAPATVVVPGALNENQSGFFRPLIAAQGDRVIVVARACDAVLVPGGVAVCYYNRAVSSSDGGATWSTPIGFNNPTDITYNNGNLFTQPVYTPDGKVHVAYGRQDPMDKGNAVLATSGDNGLTWSYTTIGILAGLNGPKLAADPRSGALVLAYQGGAGDPDIFAVRRAAGATTWSAPVRVNDDLKDNGINQQMPWLSVDRDGTFSILWHDRRHPYPGAGMEDYYYASSDDGGATWSANRRVTDRSINLDVGLARGVTPVFYWPALASLGDGRLMAAWGDSRDGNLENANEDIYTAVLGPRAGLAPAGFSAGDDVALSRLAYPGGLEVVGGAAATKVVVVNRDDPAAALAGAVLARAKFGPLLAATSSGLSEAQRSEVTRLQAIGAFIVGSEAALPAAVVDGLKAAGVPADKIVRISAATPAGLAAQVASALNTREAVVVDPASPEAAGAAALAAGLRLPYLFVSRDAVPAETASAIKSLNINKTLVIGGAQTVSDAVVAALPGATRLASAAAVLSESKARGLPTNVAYVANRADPVSVALAGAAVGRLGGLLLATSGADLNAARSQVQEAGLASGLDRYVLLKAAQPVIVAAPSAPPVTPATGGSSHLGAGAALGFVAIALHRATRLRRRQPTARAR